MSGDSGTSTSSDGGHSGSAGSTDGHASHGIDSAVAATVAVDAQVDEVVDAERLVDRGRPAVEHGDLENVPLTHVDTRTGDRCGYLDERELLVREVGQERLAEHLSPEEFHESGRFEPIA